jgi:flagellar biosynthesis GTPase FlhF
VPAAPAGPRPPKPDPKTKPDLSALASSQRVQVHRNAAQKKEREAAQKKEREAARMEREAAQKKEREAAQKKEREAAQKKEREAARMDREAAAREEKTRKDREAAAQREAQKKEREAREEDPTPASTTTRRNDADSGTDSYSDTGSYVDSAYGTEYDSTDDGYVNSDNDVDMVYPGCHDSNTDIVKQVINDLFRQQAGDPRQAPWLKNVSRSTIDMYYLTSLFEGDPVYVTARTEYQDGYDVITSIESAFKNEVTRKDSDGSTFEDRVQTDLANKFNFKKKRKSSSGFDDDDDDTQDTCKHVAKCLRRINEQRARHMSLLQELNQSVSILNAPVTTLPPQYTMMCNHYSGGGGGPMPSSHWSNNPYAQHPQHNNLYAQPPQQNNPYAQHPQQNNPYAQHPQHNNLYAQHPHHTRIQQQPIPAPGTSTSAAQQRQPTGQPGTPTSPGEKKLGVRFQ